MVSIAWPRPENEAELEKALALNFSSLTITDTSIPIEWEVYRQVRVPHGVIDLLAVFNPHDNRWLPHLTICEIKYGAASKTIVEQIQRYAHDMRELMWKAVADDSLLRWMSQNATMSLWLVAQDYRFDVEAHSDLEPYRWSWEDGVLRLHPVLRRKTPPGTFSTAQTIAHSFITRLQQSCHLLS